jgi:hypothetical protein
MNFTCIGFDVRMWPWAGEFNVDDTGWDVNEGCYADLVEEFTLKENEYQLLEIKAQDLLWRVSDYIGKKESCNLVAIELPTEIVKLQDARYGFSTALTKLDLSGFACHGFDVCDFNGLFSVLHHPGLGRANNRLIPQSQLCEALEVAQFANVLDRGHSPFVVAKIHSLIKI